MDGGGGTADDGWFDNLVDSIGGYFGTLFNAISELGQKIANIPSLVFNAFSNLLTSIWDSIKQIPSLIFKLFETILNGIVTIVSGIFESVKSIVSFITDFFTMLFEFIKSIFVPSDDYFINKFNSLKSQFSNKLGVDTSIFDSLYKKSRGVSTGIEPITVKAMGVSVDIDMSIVNNIAKITRVASTGLVMLFSVLFNYNKVVYLIRGKYAIETSNVGGGK